MILNNNRTFGVVVAKKLVGSEKIGADSFFFLSASLFSGCVALTLLLLAPNVKPVALAFANGAANVN